MLQNHNQTHCKWIKRSSAPEPIAHQWGNGGGVWLSLEGLKICIKKPYILKFSSKTQRLLIYLLLKPTEIKTFLRYFVRHF
jgi:hypothetical protein